MDLHEAAQATRISVHYLRAMEDEDFSKLPGEVFVRGFLKSYAKFLNLSEPEVMRRYQELQPPKQQTAPAADRRMESAETVNAPSEGKEVPLEPLVWGGALIIALFVLLFVSLPRKTVHETPPAPESQPTSAGEAEAVPPVPTVVHDKLYLEIIAREDVWLLVRTDSSPQKKAVLKKGESVIWSADERFLLSYGSVGAVTLLLNGNELTVKAPGSAVVRDLVITASGITTQKVQAEPQRPARPRPAPAAPQRPPVETPAVPAPQLPEPPQAPKQEQQTAPAPSDPAVSPQQ